MKDHSFLSNSTMTLTVNLLEHVILNITDLNMKIKGKYLKKNLWNRWADSSLPTHGSPIKSLRENPPEKNTPDKKIIIKK